MRKEFGKWLMDIAKYLLSAVLLSSMFSRIDTTETVLGCIFMTVCTLLFGLYLIKEPHVKVSKKLNKRNRRF